IARNQIVQLANARRPLSQFVQRQTFLQLRRRSFVAIWILLQNLVVIAYRGFVVAATVFNVGEVKLRVSGEVRRGIELQVVAEFLRSQVKFAGVVIAQRAVIEHVGRRRLDSLLCRLRNRTGTAAASARGLLRRKVLLLLGD